MNEKIPSLRSWNVKLLKDEDGAVRKPNTVGYWKGGLESEMEVQARWAMWTQPKQVFGMRQQQQLQLQQMQQQQQQRVSFECSTLPIEECQTRLIVMTFGRSLSSPGLYQVWDVIKASANYPLVWPTSALSTQYQFRSQRTHSCASSASSGSHFRVPLWRNLCTATATGAYRLFGDSEGSQEPIGHLNKDGESVDGYDSDGTDAATLSDTSNALAF